MYRGTISLTHGNFKAVHWPTVVTSYKQVSLYSASRFGHELGKKRTWVGVIWQHNYEVLVHILAVMYHTYTKQNVMLMTLFCVIWFAFVLYSRSWPRSKISRVNRYHCNVRPNYTTLQQMLHMINKNNIIEVIGIHI